MNSCSSSAQSSVNEQQLGWRCRRGVRELDVLFGRYIEQYYGLLTNAEKSDFADFLEIQDPIIMDWLFQRSQPEQTRFVSIVSALRALSGLE